MLRSNTVMFDVPTLSTYTAPYTWTAKMHFMFFMFFLSLKSRVQTLQEWIEEHNKTFLLGSGNCGWISTIIHGNKFILYACFEGIVQAYSPVQSDIGLKEIKLHIGWSGCRRNHQVSWYYSLGARRCLSNTTAQHADEYTQAQCLIKQKSIPGQPLEQKF